jgi:hypothetical protein
MGAVGRSQFTSASDILASIMLVTPGAIIGGSVVAKTGKFQWPLWIGLAMMVAGMGSWSSLTPTSSLSKQIGLQVINGLGTGIVWVVNPIVAQSGQPDHLHSTAINLVSFFRTLGQTCGIAFGSTIFQNQFNKKVRTGLANRTIVPPYIVEGQDAESAFDVIATFPASIIASYRKLYADSLRSVWYTAMALGMVAIVSSLFVKHANLNRGLTTRQNFHESR